MLSKIHIHAALAILPVLRQEDKGGEMNPEQMRIAIAEACGYKWITHTSSGIVALSNVGPNQFWKYCERPLDVSGYCSFVPNYPSDLNACADMEKTLISGKAREYYEVQLPQICGYGAMSFDFQNKRLIVSATAPKRCEAFLRTVGKWVD